MLPLRSFRSGSFAVLKFIKSRSISPVVFFFYFLLFGLALAAGSTFSHGILLNYKMINSALAWLY